MGLRLDGLWATLQTAIAPSAAPERFRSGWRSQRARWDAVPPALASPTMLHSEPVQWLKSYGAS